jgi:thiol:disulfide interchange protein DsbC
MKLRPRLHPLAFALLALMPLSSIAAPPPAPPEMVARLKSLYPNTQFASMSQSPIAGLTEVVMGENVAYVDGSGRYFLFGHVYDMQEGKDLTAALPAKSSPSIDFAALPLNDAIVNVQGNGKRKLAVFSDPDCPYCRQLAKALAQLKDVTIYTFMMPLDEIHPDARKRSLGVWCASDRSSAWLALMERGIAPKPAKCESPLDRNTDLAARLGVHGTPSLFAEDGRRMAGAAPAPQLDAFLNASIATAKEEQP